MAKQDLRDLGFAEGEAPAPKPAPKPEGKPKRRIESEGYLAGMKRACRAGLGCGWGRLLLLGLGLPAWAACSRAAWRGRGVVLL